MDKVVQTTREAVDDIPDGAVIAIGGFFVAGVPRLLLQALIAKGTKDLTFISGAGALVGACDEMQGLLRNGQIKKVIDSYALPRSATKGCNDPFEQQVRSGAIGLEVCPLGTLAERLRAAAAGIPAFYSPVGVGSSLEERVVTNRPEEALPRETKVINGRKCILEYALKPDFSLIHAYRGDREGNLQYRKTALNFNPVMAAAGRVTIAEVENLVEPGEIDPEFVHTPGIYVRRVVQVERICYPVTID